MTEVQIYWHEISGTSKLDGELGTCANMGLSPKIIIRQLAWKWKLRGSNSACSNVSMVPDLSGTRMHDRLAKLLLKVGYR